MILKVVFAFLFSSSLLFAKVINGVDLKPNGLYKNEVLKGSNFSGLNLSGAIFFNCDLRGVKFNGTNLTNAIIKRSKLQRANFRGAILENANIDHSNFSKARLINVNMINCSAKNVDFTHTMLSQVDARKANFQKSKFIKSKINDLDARKADFIGVVFYDMEIHKSKFWASDMRYIAVKDLVFKDCGLEEVKFNKESIIKNISFEDTRWTDKAICEEKGFMHCLKEGISIYK